MVVAVVPTKFGNQTHALTCLNGSPVNLDQIVSIIPSTIKLVFQSGPKSLQALKSRYLLMQRVHLGHSVQKSERVKAKIHLDEEYRIESVKTQVCESTRL